MNSKILHAAFFMPMPEGWWGAPLLLEAAPGTGKTSFVKAAVERVSLAYERLSPGERGEGQFGVVPVPGSDGLLHYPPPEWTSKFTNGGVIFLDEINTAPPALQAPLLGMVQLRTLGSYQFPKRTRIIAAQNSTEDAAGGWDMAPALANRFAHFDFSGLDANEWATAILSNFASTGDDMQPVNAETEEKRVLEAWPQAIAIANGIIGGFIMRNPGRLHMQPKAHDNKASRAWPSRRTWQYAAHAHAAAQIHGLSEIDTDAFLAGFVGIGCVSELRQWQAQLDLPNPADVLDGKVAWKHDARRLDRTLVVLSACAGLAAGEKQEKVKIARGNKCWELIGDVLNDAPDCAIPAARTLKDAKMIVGSYTAWTKSIGARVYPLLVQAGVAK